MIAQYIMKVHTLLNYFSLILVEHLVIEILYEINYQYYQHFSSSKRVRHAELALSFLVPLAHVVDAPVDVLLADHAISQILVVSSPTLPIAVLN
jgi:hypothetical protein